jgi:hypothetical protein
MVPGRVRPVRVRYALRVPRGRRQQNGGIREAGDLRPALGGRNGPLDWAGTAHVVLLAFGAARRDVNRRRGRRRNPEPGSLPGTVNDPTNRGLVPEPALQKAASGGSRRSPLAFAFDLSGRLERTDTGVDMALFYHGQLARWTDRKSPDCRALPRDCAYTHILRLSCPIVLPRQRLPCLETSGNPTDKPVASSAQRLLLLPMSN